MPGPIPGYSTAMEITRRCQIEVVPGGPVLVRGATEILDAQGDVHPTTRPVVALCVCELSQRKPWCDGTHKVAVATRAKIAR
ncbi:MAG: iron-binding zinc finger protein type [Marmoricola sp.]|nr:iron-binding zinc finger protein type [Marmoricola sp.]